MTRRSMVARPSTLSCATLIASCIMTRRSMVARPSTLSCATCTAFCIAACNTARCFTVAKPSTLSFVTRIASSVGPCTGARCFTVVRGPVTTFSSSCPSLRATFLVASLVTRKSSVSSCAPFLLRETLLSRVLTKGNLGPLMAMPRVLAFRGM